MEDEFARSIEAFVNGADDIRSPTTGSTVPRWLSCVSGKSSKVREGGVARCEEKWASAVYRYKTPSSSRTYFGPTFLFSSLHCAMTRSRLRPCDTELGNVSGSDPESEAAPSRGLIRGSHHQPSKSMPPSSLPPTRLSDMERCSSKRASERFSNAVPLCVAESNPTKGVVDRLHTLRYMKPRQAGHRRMASTQLWRVL